MWDLQEQEVCSGTTDPHLSVLPAAELLQWSFELVPREVLSDGHL